MIKTRILAENIIIPYDGKISGAEADLAAVASAVKKAKRNFGCECKNPEIHRKSIDARRKNDVKLVYSVCMDLMLSPDKAASTLRKAIDFTAKRDSLTVSEVKSLTDVQLS